MLDACLLLNLMLGWLAATLVIHGIETTCFDFKASHFSVHTMDVGLVLLLLLLDDDGEPK